MAVTTMNELIILIIAIIGVMMLSAVSVLLIVVGVGLLISVLFGLYKAGDNDG